MGFIFGIFLLIAGFGMLANELEETDSDSPKLLTGSLKEELDDLEKFEKRIRQEVER